MGTPTLKSSNLQCAGLSGTEPHFPLMSQTSRSKPDLRAAGDDNQEGEAEAARIAEARINQAATAIRALSDSGLVGFGVRLWTPAYFNLQQSKVADRQPNVDSDFSETQPRVLSSLDPQTVPDPPSFVPPRGAGLVLLRFLLMAIFAASVAAAITMFPAFRQSGSLSRKEANAAVVSAGPREAAGERAQFSRLVLRDQRAFANEPKALGVSVAPPTEFASILIGGLSPGTRLSAGAPLTSGRWELPLDGIGDVRVYAPQNFVGVMNAAVDLLAPSNKIIDRRPEHLEWIARADPSQRSKEIGPQSARSAATRPSDPHDATALMDRGRELLKNGDVALAQLAFRRLADAGSADAALALANTYDARYLAKHNLIELVGDEKKAQLWYRRASELGSPDADHMLARLDAK